MSTTINDEVEKIRELFHALGLGISDLTLYLGSDYRWSLRIVAVAGPGSERPANLLSDGHPALARWGLVSMSWDRQTDIYRDPLGRRPPQRANVVDTLSLELLRRSDP